MTKKFAIRSLLLYEFEFLYTHDQRKSQQEFLAWYCIKVFSKKKGHTEVTPHRQSKKYYSLNIS